MSFIAKNKFIINRINSNSKTKINQNEKRNSLSNSFRRQSKLLENNKLNTDGDSKGFLNKVNITTNISNKNIFPNKFRFGIYSRRIKEEEKNFSNRKKVIENNKTSFFNSKFKPNRINIRLSTTDSFQGRPNIKRYSHQVLTSTKEDKLEKELVNEYKMRNFRKLKSINLKNNAILAKQSSKTLNKRVLFLKLKDLLEEIEKEKNDRNANKKKPKKLKDISFLFLERTVKPKIPNLKNRSQLNKYLINDFKENESYQEYINRSLKYKKINENYEMAQMLKKEANENLKAKEETPTEDEDENNKEKEIEDIKNNKEKEIEDIKNNQNISSSNIKKRDSLSLFGSINRKKRITFLLTPDFQKKNTAILSSQTSEEKPISILKDYKRRISEVKSVNSFSTHFFNNKEDKDKEKEKNNSNENIFLEDEFLTQRPKKNFKKKKTEIFSSEKAILMQTKSILHMKHKKHSHVHKKRKVMFDKFTLSNNLYNEQKRYFDDYLMNKRIKRSKNFSEQMSNLAKEKDLFKINDSEGGNLPKLKEGSLIYEMKLKNLFKNSFNPMTNFKEGDEDLDLDNLKKIKNSVMEMEIEMFTSLKDEVNPKYIRSKFNKMTVGKYHSTRGVYFGSK